MLRIRRLKNQDKSGERRKILVSHPLFVAYRPNRDKKWEDLE